MFGGILENLYGKNLYSKNLAQNLELEIIAALKRILKLQPDSDGKISVSETAKNFVAISNQREIFCKRFSTILENYLVNEFFIKVYPCGEKNSVQNNYAVFVATYKLTEIFMFALAQNSSCDEDKIINYISMMARNVDHIKEFIDIISETLKGNDDTFKIISTFLQI